MKLAELQGLFDQDGRITPNEVACYLSDKVQEDMEIINLGQFSSVLDYRTEVEVCKKKEQVMKMIYFVKMLEKLSN